MHPVPVVPVWRQVHSSHESQIIDVVTPIQRHGGYDGQVVTCSTTVPVLHCPPAPVGIMGMRTVSREFPRRRADNVHDQTVHRLTKLQNPSISLLILSRPEDTDLIPIHSGEDRVALLDDDLSQPTAISGDSFRISALQKEDPVCITLQSWISSGDFPPWIEVKGLSPELRSLWHHRNNLSLDDNGVIWCKWSSHGPLLQLLVPKPAREQLFLSYHASLFGGHLGRNQP